MKYFLFVFASFTYAFIQSQEKFSKEISISSDNDLYVTKKNDRYYSSGVFLSYRYLSKNKNTSLEKRILHWQIGHKIYTPYKSVVTSISKHDRPFAGYLYGNFDISRIYKNEQILNTAIQVGFIGTNSFAKELQSFIHDIYGFQQAVGWKYQIKNAFALNFGVESLKTILRTKKKYFDITWENNLNVGSVFTNIATGCYSRIGLRPLQNITNSIAFNTNLNNEQTNSFRETESFIYLKTMLRYAFYDATLQGSFLNKKSLITKELIPLVFEVELGIKFTFSRLNFGYVINYNTGRSKNLVYNSGHKYGRIAMSYLLR